MATELALPFARGQKMKVVVYLIAAVIYSVVCLYLLLGALDMRIGLRIGGNLFAEEGFFFQRTTSLLLLVLLLCVGVYLVWRINRRPD